MTEENLMFVLLSKRPQPVINPQMPQTFKIGVDLVFSPNLQSAFKTMMNKVPNVSFEYVGEQTRQSLISQFDLQDKIIKPKIIIHKNERIKEIIVDEPKKDTKNLKKDVGLYFQYLLEDGNAEVIRAKLTTADMTDLKRIAKKLK